MVTKASTLLRRAKKLIADDRQYFVCLALWDAANNYSEHDVVRDIVTQIEWAISPHGSVGGWLRHKKCVDVDSAPMGALKDYRLRWLDHLIQTYEEAGQ